MIAGDQFETDLVRPSCIGIRLCCRIRGRIVSRWLGPGLEPGLFHLQRVSVYSLHDSVINIVPIKLTKLKKQRVSIVLSRDSNPGPTGPRRPPPSRDFWWLLFILTG